MFQDIKLSEEDFDEQYPLLRNHLNPHAGWAFEDGGCLFEMYGAELDFVRKQDPSTVWTLIDGDGHDGTDDLYLVSGVHFVNRIGYLISTVRRPEHEEIEVCLPSHSEE